MKYFEVFGLKPAFHIDKKQLKKAYYQKSRATHPDHHGGGDESILDMSSIVNVAYKTLRDDDERLHYILAEEGLISDESKLTVPQSFLMEMMDINEAVMELEMDPSDEQARAVRDQLDTLRGQLEGDVQTAMDAYDHGDKSQLDQVINYYLRVKYLNRIYDKLPGEAHA